MYELVVVWANGETNVYECETIADAESGEKNMLMAFGNQITWCGFRKRY